MIEPEDDDFERPQRDGLAPAGASLARSPDALVIDLEGYEGPLDVLLALSRDQKVDLKKISILELAEQYLAFIAEARRIRLELAADYLVMAAWLAYLKSRLLLPEPEDDGPTGEEMAARLAFQLRRLEGIREVSKRLMARKRVGIDMMPRGRPEGVTVIRQSLYDCTLFEILTAYGQLREAEGIKNPLRLRRDAVFSVEEAMARLRRLIGELPEWTTLEQFLPPELMDPFARRSAIASTLLASLQMAKEGQVEIRQGKTFGPIHIRKQKPAS